MNEVPSEEMVEMPESVGPVLLAEGGLWCTNCELFEYANAVNGICRDCGCANEDHRAADVVARN